MHRVVSAPVDTGQGLDRDPLRVAHHTARCYQWVAYSLRTGRVWRMQDRCELPESMFHNLLVAFSYRLGALAGGLSFSGKGAFYLIKEQAMKYVQGRPHAVVVYPVQCVEHMQSAGTGRLHPHLARQRVGGRAIRRIMLAPPAYSALNRPGPQHICEWSCCRSLLQRYLSSWLESPVGNRR